MTDPIQCVGTLDHVVITAADLADGADIYRRLGFTLSPKGVHSAAMGSANHTIMLRRDYFELLTVVAPTERNAEWRARLAAGGGIGGVALTTEDAAGAHALWQRAGLACHPPLPFARPVTRADGTTTEARFEVVTLQGDTGLDLRVFVCSQPTRDAVWLPELLSHANTALGLDSLIMAAADPDAAVTAWRRILPAVADADIGADGDDRVLTTPAHRILIRRDATAGAPRAIGLDIRVADLARCRAVLDAGGVPYRAEADRLEVPAEAACNVTLGFVAA